MFFQQAVPLVKCREGFTVTYTIGEVSITGHGLGVLVLGLVQDYWTSFSDLGLCNDFADMAGVVIGCVEETGISCPKNTW